MFDRNTIAFRLPSGLPALSVSPVGTDEFAATDGQERAVYVFSEAGVFLESFETVRPYTKLSGVGGETYLAVGQCKCGQETRRVYLLNCRFEEIASVDLIPASDAACDDVAELMDASLAVDSECTGIFGVFRQSVRRFDLNGKQTELLIQSDEEKLHLNYARSGTAHGLHYRKNNTEYVNVRQFGASFLGAVPEQLILRDLIPTGVQDIYGLFGYRYLYNYLLPIYHGCVFSMPEDGEMEEILRNIQTCSCNTQ